MMLTPPDTTRKRLADDKARLTKKQREEAEKVRQQWALSQTEAAQPRLALDWGA